MHFAQRGGFLSGSSATQQLVSTLWHKHVAAMRLSSLLSLSSVLVLLSLSTVQAGATSTPDYITYTNNDGETVYLDPNREPALYTRDYGECQADPVITVTRFDAAYYKDNMTITFHLGGHTAVANASVMMYIGVYAYGENRFNLTFDPCFANIRSMCPINASVPIEANGMIPVAPADVAGIPDIALYIPDFEGQAILRIFGNSTQSQIACYSAVLTNGNSFAHPAAVGSTVGIFVAVAFISSVATAIYGQGLQETRTHYAHSLSMFVVFSVLQHVFYTGALSMNFPSVVVAFWSNFGWASGMIYSKSMQDSIDQFVGNNRGNISSLGSVPSGQTAVNLGGGYSLTSIYKRAIERRALINATSGFTWYGNPVEPGLPLPGNYTSFAGTLAELHIPASNSFLTGFLWLLILITIMLGLTIALKVTLELLSNAKMLKTERLSFFRRHWIYCAGIITLRTCFIAFFMMTFLSLFQFAIGGGPGPMAIAGIVFCLFLLGMLGVSAYALWYRLSGQEFQNNAAQLQLKAKRVGKLPWFAWTRETTARETEDPRRTVLSLPWRAMYFKDPLERPHVHDDEDYLIRFGWLSARYRRSKWWFFSAWLVYELVRACFYGGGAGSPLVQVFGLLVWEMFALIVIAATKPFESNRLNMLMVYLLGFSKVVSVALCSAFDPRFGLGRILTTVIGIIIIVIQGILILCMMVAVVIGAISSWMSVRRYHDEFRPAVLAGRRVQYFAHVNQKATDTPPEKPATVEPSPVAEEPKEPYFSVMTVRRENKIEDEDPENENNFDDDEETRVSMDTSIKLQNTRPPSRNPSLRSRPSTTNLPYGARRHRASWSSRDLMNAAFEADHVPSGIQSRMSIESVRDGANREAAATPTRMRASSVRQAWTNDPSLVNAANAAVEYPPNAYRAKHMRSKSLSQTQLQSRFVKEKPEPRPSSQAQ